ATEVRVATKVAGRVAALPVHEGDRVTAGQELARIDTTDVELALAQAAADHDLADAELRLHLAGTRKEDVARLAAEADAARADLAGDDKELERMEALLARGSG